MLAIWFRLFKNRFLGRDRNNKQPRGFRPSVELLEDKIVPSTFTPTYSLLPGVQAANGIGNAPPTGYSPLQIRTAYGVNSIFFGGNLGTGTGQTIAIVDAYDDPNIVGDLDAFDSEFSITSGGPTIYAQFGAAATFLTVYNENGQAINPGNTSVPADSSGGWEVEEAIDVEMAHAMAPGAHIALFVANSNSGADLYTAVQSAANLAGVSVVSMSWGSSEWSGENGTDSVFTTPAGHQGVSFVASTGDSGAGEYPAFSPNVIAVGGTTLTLTASNTIQSETAWSTGSDYWAPTNATGGGTSGYELEPAYQESVQQTGYRTIPDVALDADPATGVPVYDSYENTSAWIQVGGTSLAAPAFAGLLAIANEGRTLTGMSTLNSSSNSQQTLTALYSLPSTAFNDITSGYISANGQTYYAGVGYDEVSGLGSPVANNMVAGLVAYGNTNAASQLAFTTEPPSSAFQAGTPFNTVVQLENASGGSISLAGVSVTITLSTGTFSNGATTMTAITNSSGQASFSVVVTTAGTYTLTASSAGCGTAQSMSFTEGASELAFTTKPPAAIGVGASFSTAVQLDNFAGNVISQSGVSVTITLSAGTFSNGSTTMTATSNSSGQASFSVIETAAGTFTLTASAAAYTSAQSPSFTVASTASKIVFTKEPPAAIGVGTLFTTVVQLENAAGTAVPQSGVNIVVTLSTGTFSNGSTIMVATTNSAGQASFSVIVTAKGSSYTLNSAASGLTSAKSTSFSVTSSTTKLIFTTLPPATVSAGSLFTAIVQLENASSAAVAQSGVTVTLTSSPGPYSTGSTIMTSVTNSAGQATFSASVNVTGNHTLTAAAAGLTGTPSRTLTVIAADWFTQHFSDPVLQSLTRTDFNRDNAITFSDMVLLLNAAESEGTVSAATFQSLQALVANAVNLNMPAYVANLAGKVIDGDAANATYQSLNSQGGVTSAALGNLKVGSTATQLNDLLYKWFFGVDEPWASAPYSAVKGTLYGSSGAPSYADVFQGDLGDCTVMASMAETAARDPAAIQNMFIYDGTNVVNGTAVNVWTARFFHNGTATYVTVDGELPAGGNLYDHPNNGVLWVALAEKAYAELNQSGWLGTLSPGFDSYNSIGSGNQGTIIAALSALTGRPASGFGMNAGTVAQEMAAGQLVVLATSSSPASQSIVADHAYAVIGYNASASAPFTVFNPWGVNAMQWGVYGVFSAGAAFLNENYILGAFTNSANAFLHDH